MLTKIKKDNMAKKGFKLPGVSPLKQTDSTNGQFFQPLNDRSYGSGSGGSYANPMSYDAYFPTSSTGGASSIGSLGDTFSSITKGLSGDSKDSDTSDDVSGSDITINALGQIPLEKPAIELERGTDPRLQQRIQDAESAGNLKKAARLKGKQDRNIVRQVEGAKRIEQRQSDRTEKTKKRQEEKTTPLNMKDKSPLGFVPNQQMQPQTPPFYSGGLTYQPPAQANQMGVAQPVFNQQTQGMAAGAFGTPAMMQKSVGVAYMTESQEEAFGPGGHSENPGLYKQLK